MPGSKPSISSQKEDGYYAERSKSGPDLQVWDFDRADLSTDSYPRFQLGALHLARNQADPSEVRTFIHFAALQEVQGRNLNRGVDSFHLFR